MAFEIAGGETRGHLEVLCELHAKAPCKRPRIIESNADAVLQGRERENPQRSLAAAIRPLERIFLVCAAVLIKIPAAHSCAR